MLDFIVMVSGFTGIMLMMLLPFMLVAAIFDPRPATQFDTTVPFRFVGRMLMKLVSYTYRHVTKGLR
jgi:hypothetical protein